MAFRNRLSRWRFYLIRLLLRAALLAACLAMVLGAGKARAAVTLVSFNAVAGSSSILVSWETATEFNNAGFYVNVSDQPSGPFNHASSFIPSTGDGVTGAQYQYEDTNVVSGLTYYYQLEVVNSDQTTEFFGPRQVTFSGSSASTATPTVTATPTQTSTGESGGETPTPTITPTVTPTPTATPTATNPGAYPGPATATSSGAYPGPATATPRPPVTFSTATPQGAYPTPVTGFGAPTQPAVATATPLPVLATQTAGGESGPTATLIPLPAIAIEFPTLTPAAQVLAFQRNDGNSRLDKVNAPSEQASLARYTPLGLIVLIWVLLGGWFFLSLRRME